MTMDAILPLSDHRSDRAPHEAIAPARHTPSTGPARGGLSSVRAQAAIPENPFAALSGANGRPLKVAILSDFTRIPYANGAVFQTRALYRALNTCGHQATLIGPRDPDASADEIPPGTVALPSLPLRTYPGVHLPIPVGSSVLDPMRWDFDICFAQTTTLLVEFGIWLRKMRGVPLLCVNTTHLAAAYDVLLPERVSRIGAVHTVLHKTLRAPMERLFVDLYNQGDGLVVLSEGLRDYWRERGVTVPIHVIPRMVPEDVFERPLGPDPYVQLLEERGLDTRGPRLVCAGRHTREKSQHRLIRIFAEHIAPHEPQATLTLVGDGPDSAAYAALARELGVARRVIFTGEVPYSQISDYYRHANLFLHSSLSETFGNVLSEALWCGSPTVAFADGMGVSSQIQSGHNGLLIDPGRGPIAEESANAAFGKAVLALTRDPLAAARLGSAAEQRARERSSPLVVQRMLANAFAHAREHARQSNLRPLVDGPKALQWLETFRHFRTWMGFTGGLFAFGHLRPAAAPRPKGIQPSFCA
ncbi:glycosyltransferase family 4 protein [Sorangium sp. So ce448]|uniref:glycosyltransferase family 4 protein n=1 Tax=Sorangium sp. So ce448 TaxID=3133314 RepID=UPI003F6022EF